MSLCLLLCYHTQFCFGLHIIYIYICQNMFDVANIGTFFDNSKLYGEKIALFYVTSGAGYFVTVTKCPDPIVT